MLAMLFAASPFLIAAIIAGAVFLFVLLALHLMTTRYDRHRSNFRLEERRRFEYDLRTRGT